MSDQPINSEPSPGRRVLRVVWGLVVLGGVAWVVVTRREGLADLARGARPGYLAIVLVLLVGQLVPSVLLWTSAARGLGAERLRASDVARATVRALPGRYVPGSVWWAVGRATLLTRDHGVPASATALIAGLETALSLLVAAVAGSGLLLAAGAADALDGAAAPAVLVVWTAGLAVVLSPPVLNRLVSGVARRRGAQVAELSWSTLGRLAGLTLLHWAWLIGTFLVFLAAFPAAQPERAITAAGAYQIGWVTGFLAPFAPQGAGVAEGATAVLLGGGAATAVLLGGLRALVLVRDLLVMGVERATRRQGAPNDDARQPDDADPPGRRSDVEGQ